MADDNQLPEWLKVTMFTEGGVAHKAARRVLQRRGINDANLDGLSWAMELYTEGMNLEENYTLIRALTGTAGEREQAPNIESIERAIDELAERAVPRYYDRLWELFVGLRAYESEFAYEYETDPNEGVGISDYARWIIYKIAEVLLNAGYNNQGQETA